MPARIEDSIPAGYIRRHWTGERTTPLIDGDDAEVVRHLIEAAKGQCRDDLPAKGIDQSTIRFHVSTRDDLLVVRYKATAREDRQP